MTDRWTQLANVLSTRPRRPLAAGEATAAAVLVPLQVVDGAIHVVYTRRAQAMPTHAGQVAFPGGVCDPTRDADAAATALREAYEEIGLAPHDVRVLGALDDISTVSSRFLITPFVGVAPHPYTWVPNPREVDTVFSVALERLRAPDAERRELWNFDGTAVPIDFFPIDGQMIWGATHRITRNLLDVLREVG
ncbi:MAG TPA: CoA pyrophosphatase [Candidatus Limnocylindria bacterium]|nr:CoA pyrophosphatase [Candidatus Limnocylindria bacterium]